MSYLHRPGGGGGAAPGVGNGSSSNGPGPAAGGAATTTAGGAGPLAPPLPPLQHPAGMSGRLSDLLDYVKVEFESVSSQAEILRRDNHEYGAHGEYYHNRKHGYA